MRELEDIHYWCALWRTPRVGAKRFQKILEAFGEPRAFFSASSTERNRFGITQSSDEIKQSLQAAEKDIAWLQSHSDAYIITYQDDQYPGSLRSLHDPPPLLYIRGQIEHLSAPQLAIVGSRSPSHEGLENATAFAEYLSRQGLVITSGLAIGIDGAAHLGALRHGQTIAVMGTGPDRIYPAKHHELAYQITQSGCVVTELPVGTPVIPQAFPRRNRMISGLALGTLVIEASLKSGSLITADTALEQNREVFAIPGSIHNPLARGCNHLIRKGAKLVETANDIFEELQSQLLPFVESKKSDTLSKRGESTNYDKNETQTRQNNTNAAIKTADNNNGNTASFPDSIGDDPEKLALWQALSFDAQPVDKLVQRSGLDAGIVASMLLILELEGYVHKLPGGRYQKKPI